MKKTKIDLSLKINALGHAHNDAFHYIVPLLLPFFQIEFSFNYFQSGLILTLHEGLRSIFSLIFGLFADRFGHKNLIISIGFIISSILLGSVIWINQFYLIIFILLLLAIAMATFHPLATAMVGEKAKPGKQGQDLSLFSAAGTLGLVTISLLFGWLVQLWGWRITCFVIALPGLWLGWKYRRISEEKEGTIIVTTKINHRQLLILFFLGKGILCLGTKVFMSFLPIYITNYIGLKPGLSAWIISIYFTGVFAGSIFISKLLDCKKPLWFATFSTASLAILIFLFTYSRLPLLVTILIGIIGLMEGIYFPSQNTWLNMISSNRNRGSLFGFSLFIEGFSATISPTIYGWFADKFGIVYAYRLTVIPVLVSFFLYILLFQMAEKSPNQNKKSLQLDKT